MCDSEIIQIHADALALAVKIQAASGNFETSHKVDGRTVTVNRGPGGQFASSPDKTAGGNDIKTQLQNFGSSVAKTLGLDKAAAAIAKLPKDARAGFDRVLTDNPIVQDVSNKLVGETKDGFDAGNKLAKDLKGTDWKQIPKKFADGVAALVEDIKKNKQDYLIGLALAGAMTFGVASALSAGTLAQALPGVIGAAQETGDLTAVGLHLLQLFSKGMWAAIVGLIVVPLMGQVVIAKAFGVTPPEKTPEEQKVEEEKARKKAEAAARLAAETAKAAAREQQDPTERKLGYMGIDIDSLKKAQEKASEEVIQKLKEEIKKAEAAWTSYMDSVGESVPPEKVEQMRKELKLHVNQIRELIRQKD
jgi:uncharacterized protein YnzC (UPF0291/DUF896 family)